MIPTLMSQVKVTIPHFMEEETGCDHSAGVMLCLVVDVGGHR
jgi:hypothetical protein